jgi:hypothetical protein
MSTKGLVAGALVLGAGDAVVGVTAGAVVAGGGGVMAGSVDAAADVGATAGDDAGPGGTDPNGFDPVGVALGET